MPNEVQSGAEHEPVRRYRGLTQLKRRWRIVIAAFSLAEVVAVGHWLFKDTAIVSDAFVFVLSLILIFRPQWFEYLAKKDQDRLKNWRTHPGQWS